MPTQALQQTATQDLILNDEITFDIRKSVIGDFLCGLSTEEVASKNKITLRQVTSILSSSPKAQSVYARYNFDSSAIRENARISELKLRYYDLVDETIDELLDTTNKVNNLPTVTATFVSLDKMQRLNLDKPTESTLETTKHVDIAETLKALKTDEDKLRFLVENK